MVLVDVNTIKSPTTNPSSKTDGSPLVNAINSLAVSNEFNKSNYGSDAKAMAFLAKELDEILDRRDLDPAEKLKIYNQKLQTYLFLVRENDNNGIINTRSDEDDANSDDGFEDGVRHEDISMLSRRRAPSTSSLFVDTPLTSKTPFHFSARKPHKSNLPRTTPKGERLRGVTERRKNSRLKGFLTNWQQYGDTEEDEED